MASNQKEPGL